MADAYVYYPKNGGDPVFEEDCGFAALVMQGPPAQTARCHAAILATGDAAEAIHTMLVVGGFLDEEEYTVNAALRAELSACKDVLWLTFEEKHEVEEMIFTASTELRYVFIHNTSAMGQL